MRSHELDVCFRFKFCSNPPPPLFKFTFFFTKLSHRHVFVLAKKFQGLHWRAWSNLSPPPKNTNEFQKLNCVKIKKDGHDERNSEPKWDGCGKRASHLFTDRKGQQGDSAGVQAYSTSIRTPSGPTARSVPPHLSVPPQASQASRPRATNASTHSDRSQTTARPQLSTAEQKDTGETIAPTEQVQPLALDDEDNLWSLVTKKKPTGKKAVLYVGNLDETVTEDKLREYIQKRSEKAGIRQPDIFSCSIIRREEGELGSWGAHLAIDHASKENLRNRHFWPGRVYARPWNFRNHNLLDAPREGDSRPNVAAEGPPAGPPGEARPQNN